MEELHHFAQSAHGQETEEVVRRDLFFEKFIPMMKRYLALGYNQAQFAAESNTHVSIVSRAFNQETIPQRHHLLRWCRVFYKHGIITDETIAEGDNLFYLLRYATPSDERKAIAQTTEQRAVVKPPAQPSPTTDELPPAPPLPDWAKSQAQFKRAYCLTFDEHC